METKLPDMPCVDGSPAPESKAEAIRKLWSAVNEYVEAANAGQAKRRKRAADSVLEACEFLAIFKEPPFDL